MILSTFNRVLLALLAGVIAFGTWQHFRIKALDRRVEAAEVASRVASGRAAAAETSAKATAKATQNHQATKDRLNEALQDNPAWADARVPDAVWDSLFHGKSSDTP